MIANRLCTLAMCGVSRGRGPEKQAPSTLQFSFNSTEHNSLGHPGSSHAELCASRRPPCIPPPSPCPPAPGSPPGWPAALLTSCSGHLLEPSIPHQQHSLSASHGASSPLLKGSAGVQKGSGQRRVHPRAWLPASLPPQGADGGQCWHLQEGLFWSFTCDPRWLRLPGGAQRHHLG